MARTNAKRIGIEAARFELDEELTAWLLREFPRVDPHATVELFTDKALALGWLYADWRAAFRNYVRNSGKYGGVAFRSGMDNPAFDPILKQAKELGFRMPNKMESPGAYRTALDAFDKQQARQAGLDFRHVLKRVPKE